MNNQDKSFSTQYNMVRDFIVFEVKLDIRTYRFLVHTMIGRRPRSVCATSTLLALRAKFLMFTNLGSFAVSTLRTITI